MRDRRGNSAELPGGENSFIVLPSVGERYRDGVILSDAHAGEPSRAAIDGAIEFGPTDRYAICGERREVGVPNRLSGQQLTQGSAGLRLSRLVEQSRRISHANRLCRASRRLV